jgi:hypothetical protein
MKTIKLLLLGIALALTSCSSDPIEGVPDGTVVLVPKDGMIATVLWSDSSGWMFVSYLGPAPEEYDFSTGEAPSYSFQNINNIKIWNQ